MKITLLLSLCITCGFGFGQTNKLEVTGNVGIGTLTPVAPLQIFNTTGSRPQGISQPTSVVLRLDRTGTNNYSYNETAEFRIGHGGPSVWGSNLDLYVGGSQNANVAADQHVMTWQYNGNVGIGTNSPSSLLHLKSISPILRFEKENVLNWLVGNVNANDFSISADNIYGGNAFTVQNGTGYIGMGTISPKERLSVNGKIRAHEIKVETTNWPDYVFDEDYKNLGLSELEQYIKINKHLPDLPSAGKIELDGLELGEMNKILLKKIEELTLHLIEKDKALKALENRMLQIEKRLNNN